MTQEPTPEQLQALGELQEMTPEQKAAQAALMEPLPTRAPGTEVPDLIASSTLPDQGLPDKEPYLRDVPIGRNKVTEEVITQRRFTLDTAKQYLLDCPKVQVFVPPDTLDEMTKPTLPWVIPVTWHGVRVWVPKCRPAFVPAPIAEILGHKAEPLRTTQAKQRGIYVTEIADTTPNSRGMVGPEIRMG